jgi:heme oxygenase
MPTAVVSTEIKNGPSDPINPVVGLRRRLRSATADAHARLDRQLGTLDLQILPDYRRFLEANAAALLPLEDALEAADVGRLFPDWTIRSRRQAIRADLTLVGGHTHPLPGPNPLDFGGLLGTMYVLEGSRLGARVLSKLAASSSDPRVARATAYLRHGEGQHLWPTFLEALERHAATLNDEDSAIEGARRAFELFAEASSRTCQMTPEFVLA